jgi:flavodoxin
LKALILLYSYHHNNTGKIANVISKVLEADVKKPNEIHPESIKRYDLVGFGSGIYSDSLHPSELELVDKLPVFSGKKAFIFSTSGITSKSKMMNDHRILRERLVSKGFEVVDEFQCVGFNTNSFLKFFGGMNKGRPNQKDLSRAEDFARKLKQSI